MVITIGNCIKEKQQITYLCGALKIDFINLKKSIPITVFGFSIGYSCWTRNVLLYGQV
jgi:hypothetical protein